VSDGSSREQSDAFTGDTEDESDRDPDTEYDTEHDWQCKMLGACLSTVPYLQSRYMKSWDFVINEQVLKGQSAKANIVFVVIDMNTVIRTTQPNLGRLI
jgi:hypothetical protein